MCNNPVVIHMVWGSVGRMVRSEVNWSDDAVDCDLGRSIGMLMRHYRMQVQPCVVELPRGVRGYQLLYTVPYKDLPNRLQMAEYLGIDRTVLPYVIDDLVEAGLIDRRANPADRRACKIVAIPREWKPSGRCRAESPRPSRRCWPHCRPPNKASSDRSSRAWLGRRATTPAMQPALPARNSQRRNYESRS